ncbi:MAG: YihY/virulence factor BrkB family protein [Thermoanaerobaculia bacterium]
MTSLWTRAGLTWKELGLRIWRQIFLDEVLGRCAELAYFFLFSLFPLLLFLTTLFGYISEANLGLRLDLLEYIRRISPSEEITALIFDTLREVRVGRTGLKLWLSLAGAIWIASNGMIAVGRTLNIACGLKETRRWWRRRIISVVLTLTFAVLITCALVLLFAGGAIAEWLSARFGSGFFTAGWHVLRWLLMLVFGVISFEMIYNYAPNLGKSPSRPWWTPGAVTGVALFLAASFGLRLYLSYFYLYSTAYGSLGAVILLLIWFYLIAFAILMGGEVNSEIANAIAARKREERNAEEGEREERRKRREGWRVYLS